MDFDPPLLYILFMRSYLNPSGGGDEEATNDKSDKLNSLKYTYPK
jgi:hypothetical protein